MSHGIGLYELRMQILVSLVRNPSEVIPVWAAFTDAMKAIPGLEITLIGPEDINGLIRKHPAVTRLINIDEGAWHKPFWSPAYWRARREFNKLVNPSLQEETTVWIDPFGTAFTRTLTRNRPGRRVGVAQHDNPLLNRDYSSVFPVPEELHPVQSLRVLFAAELGYSLHDLVPDYGFNPKEQSAPVETDIVIDLRNIPWADEERQRFRERLAETDLSIVYLDFSDPDLDEAAQLMARWQLIADTRYLLAGLNSTAWLAAALGRPGLCLCPPEQASSSGVISTHWATQKIINIDRNPFNEPHIVAESIIQVLQRHRQVP